MHEVKDFIELGKGIFLGLKDAAKTDIDVFLIMTSAILWPLKVLRGFSIGTLFYVACRRAEGLMMAYKNIKDREYHESRW